MTSVTRGVCESSSARLFHDTDRENLLRCLQEPRPHGALAHPILVRLNARFFLSFGSVLVPRKDSVEVDARQIQKAKKSK